MCMRQRVRGVIADGTDVPEMVMESLQLEEQCAQVARSLGDVEAEQAFGRFAIGEAVTGRRISRDPLRQWDSVRDLPLLEQLFDASVLPEQTDLQLEDRLARH